MGEGSGGWQRSSVMRASIGDRLLVRGSKAAERDRACTVLVSWDSGGEPDYDV